MEEAKGGKANERLSFSHSFITFYSARKRFGDHTIAVFSSLRGRIKEDTSRRPISLPRKLAAWVAAEKSEKWRGEEKKLLRIFSKDISARRCTLGRGLLPNAMHLSPFTMWEQDGFCGEGKEILSFLLSSGTCHTGFQSVSRTSTREICSGSSHD